jgi:hypothetical protein
VTESPCLERKRRCARDKTLLFLERDPKREVLVRNPVDAPPAVQRKRSSPGPLITFICTGILLRGSPTCRSRSAQLINLSLYPCQRILRVDLAEIPACSRFKGHKQDEPIRGRRLGFFMAGGQNTNRQIRFTAHAPSATKNSPSAPHCPGFPTSAAETLVFGGAKNIFGGRFQCLDSP